MSTWVSWGFIQVRRAEVNVFDTGRFLTLSMYLKVTSLAFFHPRIVIFYSLCHQHGGEKEAKLFNFFLLSKVAATAMGDSDPG